MQKMSDPDPVASLFGSSPETVTPFFVGRQRELQLLDQMLAHSGGSPAFLVGPAGIGKTALCRAYLQLHSAAYSGSLFCSAAQFSSPDALVNYIDYEGGQMSRQRALSAHDKYDSRPLLVVDDVDRFTEQEASYLLTLLHSRAANFVSLCTSRDRFRFLEIAEIPSLELRVGPLPKADLVALLSSRFSPGSDRHKVVEQFLSSFQQRAPLLEYLTPRVVLHLFQSYMIRGDLSQSIAELSAREVSASNIVIFEHEGRLRAFPVLQGTLAGIIAPSKPPIWAAPYIVVPHLGAIWRTQLEEFEELIANAASSEKAFQSFFEKNPHFLKGIAYNRVLAHPSLIREGDGDLIPDFMLQPIGSNFADILDLKRPDASLVTGRKNRRRFAQGVHEAIAQVCEYREYFERPEHRRAVEQRYGLTAYRPSGLIVIGRQPESMTEEQMKRIAGDVPSFIQVQTYDDILRKMRRMVELKEN